MAFNLKTTLIAAILTLTSLGAHAQTRLRSDVVEITPRALPSTGKDGDVRLYNSDKRLYTWDSDASAWKKVGPLTNEELPAMEGATTGVAGKGGAVPAPGAGEQDYVLTGAGDWVPAGTGTVTSVDLAVPSILGVTGNPITTSGTITLSLSSQVQNTVFASPNGSGGTPSFRSLVAADIPSLAGTKITSGLVGVTVGGTGADLSATGGTGQFLKQSSAGGAISVGTISAGELPSHTHAASDVTSGLLALARGGTATDLSATGGTGQFLKQLSAGGTISVATISAGELPSHTHAASDITSGTLSVDRGGTGASTLTTNGVLLGNGTSSVSATSAGTANQVFRVPGAGGSPAFGQLDLSSSAAVTSALGIVNGGTGVTTQTASRAVVTDGSANITSSSVTATELGYLSGATAALQTQLNAKEPTLTKGDISGAGTVSIAGGTGAIIGSGVTVSVSTASGSTNGVLTQTDWTTFNNKQNALGYTPINQAGDTMTGDLGLAGSQATASRALVLDSQRRVSSSAVTDTELAYLSGVSASVQTQLNVKLEASDIAGKVNRSADTMTGALGLDYSGANVSTALILDSDRKVVSSSVSDTELGYVSGVTAALQTQLNAKLEASDITGKLDKAGDTMTGALLISDTSSTALVVSGNVTARGDLSTGGRKFSQTASTSLSGTTTETTLFSTGAGSMTFSANTLQVGDSISLRVGGLLSCTATPTLTLRFKIGALSVVAQNVTPSSIDTGSDTENYCDTAEKPFNLDVMCVVRSIGVSGSVFCAGGSARLFSNNKAGGVINMGATSATTIDTTAAQTIGLTGQWDAASADNEIQVFNAVLRIE